MRSGTLHTHSSVLILVVRHGRTGLNDPDRPIVRGWEDVPLSADGRIDASKAASLVKTYDPKRIYHSDFMRDTETAQDIASLLGNGTPIEPDYDLRTWDVGDYSGKPEAEVNQKILRLYQNPWERPPGSRESFSEFTSRFMSAFRRKLDMARDFSTLKPILVVTHGRNVAHLHSFYSGVPEEKANMPMPGGVARISELPDGREDFSFLTETEPLIADV